MNSEGDVIENHFDESFVNKSREWDVKILPLIANYVEDFDGEVIHSPFRS